MKKLLLISFSICYIHIAAQVTYLTEQFEYPAGDFLIDNGWFAHSASGTNSVAVSTSGLNWSGYVASGIGNAALVTNTGEDVNKPFSSYPTEGSVYASFLMRVNAPFAASGSGFFFHLGYYNNTSTPVFTSLNTAFRARTFVLQGTNPSTQFKLGLSFNTNDATGSTDDLVIGQTYLVVVKYEFIDGANNDEVSLFVFPEGANIETEPTTPDLGPFTGSAADAPVLQAAVLRQYNAAQDVTVDGIVARDSWNIAVDCAGVLGGTAFIDNCDDCVGGTTGLEACVVDCNGVFNGSAFLDNCDVCVGGNTGLDPCVADCNGDFGGTAIIDNCDVCVGGNTGLNACVADCNGDFGGTAYLDTCNDCVAGNTGETPCPISFMEDQFNYTAGVPLTNHGWFAHSAAGTNPILVHSSGLAFTSYLGSNIGNAAAVTNTGQDINKPFSENATTGDVYASYLVRVDDPVIAASEGFFMHFGTYSNTDNPTFTNLSTAFRGRVHVTQGDNSDKFKLGLSFNAAAASGTTADLNVGQTYLVVVKYQFVPGETNDTVSLYVFEDGDDFSVEPLDPTIGPLTATPTNPSDPESTLAPDAPVIQAIALRQYNANQNIIVDGIFVKNTWDLLDNCDVLTWYADNDGDGFGVDTDSILACDSPGANYVLVGGDCDDTDATIYPGAPVICYDGIQQDCNLDETDGCPQITTQLLPNDCNSTLTSMTQTVRAAFATVPAGVSVNAYRFLVTNTATNEFREVTTSNRVFSMALTDIAEYNSTYTVEVALLLNAEWQPYGPACTLTTPGLPTTTLAASSCNTVLASMTSLVRANTVTSTISYEFAVSLIEGGIPVGSTTIVRPNAAFNMTQLTGIDLKFAAEYEVSVRVLLPTSSGDQWSDYGAVCSVFTPQALESFVEGCSAETGLSPATLNTTIYTRPASGLVTEYQFRLVNEVLNYDVTISSTFRTFRLSNFNAVSPLTAGATYTFTSDYELYGFFYGGKDCNITVPGGAKMANDNEQTPALVNIFDGFKALASPNPFNGSFNLNVYTNSTESVKVAIYDMTGRLLETKEVGADVLSSQLFGERYPSGVYNIVVTQDEEMQTVRAIKK